MKNNFDQAQYLIWDWNGTLFNDSWLCVEILNELMTRRNRPPVSMETYQAHFGFPVIDYYRSIGLFAANESFENVASEFMAEYERRRLECKLQAGAIEALNYFSKLGRQQFILSAYKHDSLEEIVAHYEVGHYFEGLSGLADHYAKSKLESGLRMMSDLKIAPAKALLIGDTLHDHEVATAIGVNCILIPSGHQSVERLKASGAHVALSLFDMI